MQGTNFLYSSTNWLCKFSSGSSECECSYLVIKKCKIYATNISSIVNIFFPKVQISRFH